MNEELVFYIQETRELMEKAIVAMEKELGKIRAGKASPDMLSGIMVDYYGMPTPINQVANIKNLDARTLLITPYERKSITEIEKAIFQANLGVTPQNDGENIRIAIPPTTEERRRDLVKQTKQVGEIAKIAIRNARKEANDAIKDLIKNGLSEDEGKDGEDEVQHMTNNNSNSVDKILDAKEKEIMTI